MPAPDTRVKMRACQRYLPSTAPSGWDVAELRRRLTLEYGASLPERDRIEGPYAVYGSNGKVGDHVEHLCEPPGILVGRKGSVGEVHLSEEPYWPIDTVYYVKQDADDDPYFLFYLLSFLDLRRLNAATGLPGLSRRDAYHLLGAFPPLDEQSAIVSVLRAADEAIARAKDELTAARRVKTALMQRVFRFGLEKEEKGQDVQVLNKQVQIRSDWQLYPVRDLVERVQYGTNAASNDRGHGYRVVAIPQVVAPRLELKDTPWVELSDREADDTRLIENDVLVIRTNGNPSYVGKSTLVGPSIGQEHVVFASYLIRIQTIEKRLRGAYLNYYLASSLGRRQALALANTSAGNHNLGARSLKQFLIPVPNPSEQDEIISVLHSAEDTIDAIEDKIHALGRLKKSLMQNLLTGKVRVKPAANPSGNGASHG